jgi:uncharacterized protein (DUF1330 family)
LSAGRLQALALAFALTACATAPAPGVAKGYIVAELAVADADAYREYAALVPPIVAKYGGRYLVRGGESAAKEGAPPAGRVVVIEFDTIAAARAFYDAPEYQAIAPLRIRAANSRVFLVEGTPPQ